jgi:hypothetical protein
MEADAARNVCVRAHLPPSAVECWLQSGWKVLQLPVVVVDAADAAHDCVLTRLTLQSAQLAAVAANIAVLKSPVLRHTASNAAALAS